MLWKVRNVSETKKSEYLPVVVLLAQINKDVTADDNKTYRCQTQHMSRPGGGEPEGRHLGHCASEESASFTATPVATSRVVHAALTGGAFVTQKRRLPSKEKVFIPQRPNNPV